MDTSASKYEPNAPYAHQEYMRAGRATLASYIEAKAGEKAERRLIILSHPN
jgi:hypothetical protein